MKTLRDMPICARALATEQAALGELKRGAERLGLTRRAFATRRPSTRAGPLPALHTRAARSAKAAIGAQDVEQIEEHYGALGKPLETRAEQLHEELAKAHRKLSEGLAKCDESVRMAEFQLTEGGGAPARLNAAWKAKTASLGSGDVDELLASAPEEITRRAGEVEAQAQLAACHNREQQSGKREAGGDGCAGIEQSEGCAGRHARGAPKKCAAWCRPEGRAGEMRARIEQLDRGTAVARGAGPGVGTAALPAETRRQSFDVEHRSPSREVAAEAHERAKVTSIVAKGRSRTWARCRCARKCSDRRGPKQCASARARAGSRCRCVKLLRDTLRETERGRHASRPCAAGPVTRRFEQLTQGRYNGLRLDATLRAEGLSATASNADSSEVLEALSVGTRGQLAALLRLSIADQMRCTVVLDDHLVHTDAIRLDWFQDALRTIAVNTQVIVITCRSQDYLSLIGLPADGPPTVDLAAGTVRAVDMARAVDRFGNADTR